MQYFKGTLLLGSVPFVMCVRLFGAYFFFANLAIVKAAAPIAALAIAVFDATVSAMLCLSLKVLFIGPRL